MKMNSFISAVCVGFGLSIFAAVVIPVLSLWVPAANALLWVLACITLIYIVFLMRSFSMRFGATLFLASWLLLTGALVALSIGVIAALVSFGLLIWVHRSIIRYQSLWAAIGDGFIVLISICAGVVAYWYSNSLFLGFWSAFLIQASVFFIPSKISPKVSRSSDSLDPFEQALRTAEKSLQRLNNMPLNNMQSL